MILNQDHGSILSYLYNIIHYTTTSIWNSNCKVDVTRTEYNSFCNIELLLSPSSSFIIYHRHYFVFIQDISRHTGTVNSIKHDNNSNIHDDDDDDDDDDSGSSRSKR